LRDKGEKLLAAVSDLRHVHHLAVAWGPSGERDVVMSKNRAARRLADQVGIAYAEALRRVRQYQHADETPLLGRLREAVQAECESMAGSELREIDDGRQGSGLDFRDVGMPDGDLDGLTVDVIEPDLESIEWELTETLDGGTMVGVVEVRSSASFDGYIHKADLHGRDDLTVMEFDWNDHMSWIAVTREARLRWNVIVDPGQDPQLDFDEALSVEVYH